MWDDTSVNWSGFDLVVPRSTWDYAERLDMFLDWAEALPRVLNPPAVLRWNTNKGYLADLAAAAIPVVPTRYVAPGERLDPPTDAFVVKPAVSAGGRSSARFAAAAAEAEAAHALIDHIHAGGRTAMVQPDLGDVQETALVFLGDAYSHALHRRVGLPEANAVDGLYLDEELAPAVATADERAVAERAVAAAGAELLYARVDLAAGLVLELELVEPSLYLAFGEGAVDRFAELIARAAAGSQRG